MRSDELLRRRLEADTASVLQIIARIAPQADLPPSEIARLDQLAAEANASRARYRNPNTEPPCDVAVAEGRPQGRPAGNARPPGGGLF
jgi:hypothetical protein